MDGYIPPRLSSSPPPFEDNFGTNDIDSIDSSDKDAISRGIDFTESDFDNPEQSLAAKPVLNGVRIKAPKITPVHQELNGRYSIDSPEADETAVLNQLNQQKNVTKTSEVKLESTCVKPLELELSDGTSVKTIEVDLPPSQIRAPTVVTEFIPTDIGAQSQSLEDHVNNDSSSLAEVRSDGSTSPNLGSTSMTFDNDENESPDTELVVGDMVTSNQALDVTPEENDILQSAMVSDVVPESSDALSNAEEQPSQIAASAADEFFEYADSSEWADFACSSENVPDFQPTVTADDTESAAPNNEDDWDDFSDFASSAPSTQAHAGSSSEPTQVPILPEDKRVSFSEVLADIFPFGLEPELTSGPVAIDLDLNHGADFGSQPGTTTKDPVQMWKLLKDLDETQALKFQWSSSSVRQALLRSLNLSYLSAFSMQKKDAVSLSPRSPGIETDRGSGSMLMPVKFEQLKVGVHNGLDHTIVPEPKFDGNSFDNQLLDFLGPGSDLSNDIRPSSDKSRAQILSPSSLSGTKRGSTSSTTPSSSRNIPITRHSTTSSSSKSDRNGISAKRETNVDEVIAKFRDLNFMQSNVLVVPATAPKKVAKF